MTGTKRTQEVITKKNWKKVRQAWEDATVHVWKSSRKIVPKMFLDLRVHFQEVYASMPGLIFSFTPFWRGKEFTEAILMHEFLHWAIYPVDLYRQLYEIFKARKMLAEEMKFKPEINQTDLYGQIENWEKFPISIPEFAFCANLLGDYLINLHIYDYHSDLWNALWDFLYHDGTFYEKQKALQRDTSFLVYLSVYHEIHSELDDVKLLDPGSIEAKEKVTEIVTEVRKGRMSTVFALKELVKIFHSYLEADAKQAKAEGEGGQGQGKGQDGNGEGEPKCPACGHNEFEIVEYEDPETGKWEKI